MKKPWHWLQRRLYEFRVADAQYSRYILSFIQWVIIVYGLYLAKISWAKAIFTSLTFFAVSFICFYIPANILLGHFFHRKRQLHTEIEISTLANPYLWKAQPGKEISLSLPLSKLSLELNMKLWKKFGLLTVEEEKQIRSYLHKIEELIEGKRLVQT